MVIISQRIRIYPTDKDIEGFKKYIGYSRYLYNKAIDVQKELWLEYKEKKSKIEDFDLLDKKVKKEFYKSYYPHSGNVKYIMTRIKSEWEYDYASRMVSTAAENVCQAVKNAFNPKMPNHKLPKYKTKKKQKKLSFSLDGILIKNNKVIIPKAVTSKLTGIKPKNPIIFSKIPLATELRYTGKIAGYPTISSDKNNKWYISIPIKLDEESEKKYIAKYHKNRDGKPECGIDANIRGFRYNKVEGGYEDWLTLDNRLKKQYKLIKYYSRVLAKKRLGNKNWKNSKTYAKMRTKLNKSYTKAYNIQEDTLNQFIKYLNENYSSVTIEDLDVNRMKMNKRLCKSLHRSLFGRFKQKIEMKFNQINIEFVKADRFYPSTQRCSSCGYVKTGDEKLGLSGDKYGNAHNEYKCYSCGEILERDDNAVENLKQYKYLITQ